VPTHVHGLCSMATKVLLADLGETLRRCRPLEVHFESAGGVEVVRSIRDGARADLAVLGEDQMADLESDGLLLPGTLRPLFVSDVVAAVAEGTAPLPLSTEDDLRAALAGARRIAYSTGPSGQAFLDLLERWELAVDVGPKLVRAVPGSPVGSLVADGEADLGLQQRSELSGVAGVRVLGPLPGAAALRSTFSGAVLTQARVAVPAREVLDFLASDEVTQHVDSAGMSRA
jgi:molybdate transport system substrate-binding protein